LTALKCKLCGGNIEITGESHGICDSCGSEVTLPKIDDDKRADMYNRGNHFRQIGDFDRAYSAYEHIIADDESDAEAHWCLTLCRYGVEYVKDPRSGEYKPTVSRMNYEKVLDDPDYLAALAASDEYTKELYRKEAGKIDRIQSRYLEISRREAPYDVFICFKAQEENGQRTKGSVLAQEIYENLTEKGFKVFFSRITLEGMSGEEYEPYIFAALHSAKVLLLTADKPEHLQARWVKNEWSRYLSMMDKDRSKHIVPVFVDMSPYDFPAEIPTVQGQDMSRVGAMQDLIRGVGKLTGRVAEAQVVTGSAGVTVAGILTRVRQALEDGVFEEAFRLTEEALNREPENGEAYYYGLLAKNEVRSLPDPKGSGSYDEWTKDRYFKRALQYGSEERKRELHEFEHLAYELPMLASAEELIAKKQYREARERLVEMERKAKEDAYVLANGEKIVRLRAQCEEILARQKEERRNLAAYHAQIDPPDTYVTRTIQKRHRDVAEKYESLVNAMHVDETKVYKKGKGFGPLVSTLAAIGIGALLWREMSVPLLLAWNITCMLPGSYTSTEEAPNPEFPGFIVWGMVSAITFGISFVITMFLTFQWLRLAFPLIAVWQFFVSLNQTRITMKCASMRDAVDDYDEKILIPLEEEIRSEVTREWTDKIGADNLVNLPGYRTGNLQ